MYLLEIRLFDKRISHIEVFNCMVVSVEHACKNRTFPRCVADNVKFFTAQVDIVFKAVIRRTVSVRSIHRIRNYVRHSVKVERRFDFERVVRRPFSAVFSRKEGIVESFGQISYRNSNSAGNRVCVITVGVRGKYRVTCRYAVSKPVIVNA